MTKTLLDWDIDENSQVVCYDLSLFVNFVIFIGAILSVANKFCHFRQPSYDLLLFSQY